MFWNYHAMHVHIHSTTTHACFHKTRACFHKTRACFHNVYHLLFRACCNLTPATTTITCLALFPCGSIWSFVCVCEFVVSHVCRWSSHENRHRLMGNFRQDILWPHVRSFAETCAPGIADSWGGGRDPAWTCIPVIVGSVFLGKTCRKYCF